MLVDYTYSSYSNLNRGYKVVHKDRDENQEHQKRESQEQRNSSPKHSSYHQNSMKLDSSSQIERDVAKLVGLGTNLNLTA